MHQTEGIIRRIKCFGEANENESHRSAATANIVNCGLPLLFSNPSLLRPHFPPVTDGRVTAAGQFLEATDSSDHGGPHSTALPGLP